METTRTAQVARTAYDLTHVNKLRVPEFYILSLYLDTGSKCSKSYVVDGMPSAAGGSSPSDDFHFAPENEKPAIKYEIDDKFGNIRFLKLELFRRFDETAVWKCNLTKLGDDTYSDGKHSLTWDGRIFKDPTTAQAGSQSGGATTQDLTGITPDKTLFADFPDGYVTLQHTAYKLKMTVSDKAEGEVGATTSSAWTYFHILVKKFDLELGPKKALPKPATGKPDLDAQVYDDTDTDALNGNLPTGTGRKKLFLSSNIFKNSNGQLHSRADFTSYQDKWGDGPRVPIFAKVWVRDSSDAAVECPKALGKVKFLWEAEDVKESDGSVYGGHHAKAKAFLDDSVNYYIDTSKPKGDNCHKDRGGKRGDDTKTFFPSQAGYGYGYGGEFDSDAKQDTLKDREFPFKVVTPTKRKWSGFSYAWTQGTLVNKTGVLFQPSRFGGDAYKVTIYLANEKKDSDNNKLALDVDTDLPKVNDATKATTGTFELWRRLNFVQYMKKTSTVSPDFSVATFQGYYKQAFVQVVYSAGSATSMDKTNYDSRATSAKNALAWDDKLMVDGGSQYDKGNMGISFRSYAAWKTMVKLNKGWNDTQLNSYLGTVLDTEAKYNAFCSNLGSSMLTSICEAYMAADDGINLFQFVEHYNLATSPGGVQLNGFAPGAAVGIHKADTTNSQCFFVLCAGPTNYSGTNNTAAQTVTHEIGHCLFMAHAPVQTATDEANRQDETVHDKDFNNCTMSYNYDAERKWCGFCILRLRGWDRAALKNDRTQNKKP